MGKQLRAAFAALGIALIASVALVGVAEAKKGKKKVVRADAAISAESDLGIYITEVAIKPNAKGKAAKICRKGRTLLLFIDRNASDGLDGGDTIFYRSIDDGGKTDRNGEYSPPNAGLFEEDLRIGVLFLKKNVRKGKKRFACRQSQAVVQT